MNLKRVLISGASIAGPTLAYWLAKRGFDVTVVERAATVRAGGYPIDIRGTAMEVVRRMGLEELLRSESVDVDRLTFFDEDGARLAAVRPLGYVDGVKRDLELPRGALTAALFSLTRRLDYRFSESISALEDDGEGVNVTFASGVKERFALVIGADGIHSSTRRLAFGDEAQFSRSLGYCFAGFELPNEFGMAHEGRVWATVGRSAMLYAPGDSATVHGMLVVAAPEVPPALHDDDASVRAFMVSQFPDDVWLIPKMRACIQTSRELFYDEVAQIRMVGWSRGRVALVGDAAHAPSFLTGQGTSLALVGAYVLADALSTHADHRQAFTAYEARCRPYVDANLALASASSLMVKTREALEARKQRLRALDGSSMDGGAPREAYSLLAL